MVIIFLTNELEELCSKEREANKKLGKPCARKLRTRLADLMAAPCVADLTAGRPHPLKGDLLGKFALDLKDAMRLVFEPAQDPVPLKDDGSIDWSQVTNVRIVHR